MREEGSGTRALATQGVMAGPGGGSGGGSRVVRCSGSSWPPGGGVYFRRSLGSRAGRRVQTPEWAEG